MYRILHSAGEVREVGLEHIREFPRFVRLDQHESRSAAGQVVPASNSIRLVRASVILLKYATPERLSCRLWVP
jgi:hypothetical protein